MMVVLMMMRIGNERLEVGQRKQIMMAVETRMEGVVKGRRRCDGMEWN